jgi:ABC-type Fe3+ transport system permease subunit
MLAGVVSVSTLYRVENGFVNLVAVVGFLILAIGLIPMVLFLGSPEKQPSGTEPKQD